MLFFKQKNEHINHLTLGKLNNYVLNLVFSMLTYLSNINWLVTLTEIQNNPNQYT